MCEILLCDVEKIGYGTWLTKLTVQSAIGSSNTKRRVGNRERDVPVFCWTVSLVSHVRSNIFQASYNRNKHIIGKLVSSEFQL